MSFLILPLVIAYLAPTWIAAYRDLRDKNFVFLLNLLSGWTIIGWIASLIWACVGAPTSHKIEAAGDQIAPQGQVLLQGRDPRI